MHENLHWRIICVYNVSSYNLWLLTKSVCICIWRMYLSIRSLLNIKRNFLSKERIKKYIFNYHFFFLVEGFSHFLIFRLKKYTYKDISEEQFQSIEVATFYTLHDSIAVIRLCKIKIVCLWWLCWWFGNIIYNLQMFSLNIPEHFVLSNIFDLYGYWHNGSLSGETRARALR